MNLRLLPLFLLCSTLTAQTVTESKADIVSLAKQKIELLSSVRDHESANAAAPVCKRLNYAIGMAPETGEHTEELDEKLIELSDELKKNFFYGSAKLARAMDEDEYKAILPQPVTPQIIAELEERARLSFELVPAHVRKNLSGGPGFSRETAWVFTSKTPFTNRDWWAPIETHLITGYGIGSPSVLETRFERTADRFYRINTVALFHRGKCHKVDIWEDVTGCYVRVSPEEEARALAEFSRMMQDWTEQLRCVKDKKTAAATSEKIVKQIPRYRELLRIIAGMLPEDTKEAEAQEDLMLDILDHIAEYGFHGSEILHDIIWVDIDEDEEEDETSTLKSMHDDTQACLAQYEAKLKLLRGVHDKDSADAAADSLLDLTTDIHSVPHYVTGGLHERMYFDEVYDDEENRLRDARCYGSASLAEVLECEDELHTPQALTPEAANEIEQLIRTALAESPHDERTLITGGPGFTHETAWRIPAEISTPTNHSDEDFEMTHNAYEDLLLDILIPNDAFSEEDIKTGTINGRLYRVTDISVTLNDTLYAYKMWVDLTDGRDIPTEAEYKAAYAAKSQQLKETAEILSKVTDTATADAAAELLKKQKKLWMPNYHPMDSDEGRLSAAPIDDVLEAYIEDRKEEICDKNCYDSSALKILLYTPSGKSTEDANLKLTEEEMAARKDMLTQQKLQYVRTLAQLLPGITDRASAIAAAHILSPLAEDVYSHINLLQREDITRQIDTLPIRRHLKRITRECFFDSHELAELLREHNSPSGPNSYQAPVDDVEEEEDDDEDIEEEEDDDIDVEL